ncbi:hypothetical protein U9M48_014863 [Paspalum notatum var. saurae]|uniref:Uncharacterized protein n=1 Tax=Paspalum notatum var. saurae TaxID=547442 RepID=A0AAQ3T5G4_PASNO
MDFQTVPRGEVSRTPDEVSREAESAGAASWQNKKLGVPWEAFETPCSICCGRFLGKEEFRSNKMGFNGDLLWFIYKQLGRGKDERGG